MYYGGRIHYVSFLEERNLISLGLVHNPVSIFLQFTMLFLTFKVPCIISTLGAQSKCLNCVF